MSRAEQSTQVPANLSATETLFEAMIGGQRVSRFVNDGLDHLAVETATPVRSFVRWKGKRNYEGRYFSVTTGGHLVFESLLERDYLITVDADPAVHAVASQPFLLIWPRGTAGGKFSSGPGARQVASSTTQTLFSACATGAPESWTCGILTALKPPRSSSR